MFSVRERLCAIITTTVSALFVIAMLTAASTVVRTSVLRPQPIIFAMEVTASPVVEAPLITFLMEDSSAMATREHEEAVNGSGTPAGAKPREEDLLWDSPYAVDGVLDTNVRFMTEAEKEKTGFVNLYVPETIHPAVRTVDRVVLRISGIVDFSALWDWNTKAIYVAVVARYSTSKTKSHPAMPLNEVTFADAVIRGATLPRSLRHLRDKPLATMTAEEAKAFVDFCRTFRRSGHDHESVFIDHVHKQVIMNQTAKYMVDDFYNGSLAGEGVTVVVRYQVMSHSGWAPLREDVLYGVKHVILGTEKQSS